MGKKIVGAGFTVLLMIYFITLVPHISAHYDRYLWDFRTHRIAGAIFASDRNPYDPDVLVKQEGGHFPYTYPPATLHFYKLFALWDYKTAFHVFLIAKCILLIGLVYFWKREFLREEGDTLFYFFSLLAFNCAVFLDIRAGNINLVEQVLLWVAFYFYLKGRLALFCAFALLAASFKMTPIFFLVLLLVCDDKRKYHYFAAAASIFLAYLLVQYLITPDLFAGFLRNAFDVVGERGAWGPSSSKFVDEFFRMISKVYDPVPRWLPSAVIISLTAAVFFLTGRAYLLLKRIQLEDAEKIALFLICLLYGLIHPRFKDYAYMLLIVPSYYIMKNARYTKAYAFIFALTILASPHVLLPGIDIISPLVWRYFPLMLAYAIWGIYLYEIFSAAKNQDARS